MRRFQSLVTTMTIIAVLVILSVTSVLAQVINSNSGKPEQILDSVKTVQVNSNHERGFCLLITLILLVTTSVFNKLHCNMLLCLVVIKFGLWRLF